MKSRVIAPAALLVVLLSGCSAGVSTSSAPAASDSASATAAPAPTPTPIPVDLAGDWKQTNSNSPDAYQAATITGDTISINWVDGSKGTTAVYWVGSYTAPTDDAESFTWTSKADAAAMDNSLLASQDDTKTFTYNDGVLAYELRALGKSMTVEMRRP